MAEPGHMEAIAHLHAFSWQTHYRGIFNDSYLDHDVLKDRLEVWKRRFENPSKEQFVILAKDDDLLCGFGCVYLNHHQQYGALLDNLHVHRDWQGRGIGEELVKRCTRWVQEQAPHSPLYLWVLKENRIALAFYEKLGGKQVENIIENNPGGGTAEIVRIFWEDLAVITALNKI